MFDTTTKISFRARGAFSRESRSARMRWLLEAVAPRPGQRIVDLGGTPKFWASCPVPLDITIMNLPGVSPAPPASTHHAMTLVEGDACNTGFDDGQFDLVVSNSVIEHVGDAGRRSALSHEVRRLAPRYWVQTPSIWFPVEAHSLMPGWWFYPPSLRAWFIRRWRSRLPAWSQMVEDTTVLSRREMAALFPDAMIHTERRFGLPKSYVAMRL
ncbi:MAG: methyltransferase domain-containing protein [Paracoccaceae bacterium]|jgi:SAM-dependent methyltransferase|nr:methyltransferase domain-containing protein [Paracoccaceae bacterium]